MEQYILGSSRKELERLRFQSRIFEAETLRTLQLSGIRPGMRCVDVGCGLGDSTFMIANLVGKDGTVIGIDPNIDVIEMCRKQSDKEKIKNVEFLAADVYNNKLKKNSFDFVFSRFLFQHLVEPKKALREMIKLAADGGIVAAEENDHAMWLTYPPSIGFEKLRCVYVDLLRLSNCDELIARKLYGSFLDHGLATHVGAYSICVPMEKPFDRLGIMVAEVLKSKILKLKVMSEKEFRQMMAELKQYARIKSGLALYAITFRIWGKK